MPVITFANTKGGAGKTTVALVVASELARRGHRVTVLDCDPLQWVSKWSRLSGERAGFPVVSDCSDETIEEQIKSLKKQSDYTIIDLAGGLTSLLAKAIGLSDHVFVPVQGCAMDAAGGAQVLDILKELSAQCGIQIPHSVILTRISSIITTRALLAVKTLLAQQQVNVLSAPLVERAAYRDMFNTGGTIYTMDASRVSNLDKAQENARLLGDEIVALLPLKAAKPKAVRKPAAPKKKAA